MPKNDLILNLPGFTIQKVRGYQPLILELSYNRKARCGHCASKEVRKKASYMRRVAHELIGHRRSELHFKAYKLYCHSCRRYGNQQFPGINKHQRSTWRLQAAVFHDHTRGISQKDLAKQYNKGKATIERWYQQHYREQERELTNAPCPIVLGIDEHSFSRKQGYATTLCDLKKHKVYDIVKGRSSTDLKDYFKNLPHKERVKVVCIDLSTSYRALVKQHFPHAQIVADRFHVIRLVNQFTLQTFHHIDPTIKYQRGLLAALKTKPENLTAKRLTLRDNYLKQQPAIAAIYDFKQELHQLLSKKHCTAKECKRLLPRFLEMINELRLSPFQPLQTLGNTLFKWREEIARMLRFTKNNGITEGFHRKMKLIQRRAYGFKNFENYRTRVRVLCC
ncbi:ISL3 family transposase [Legionella maceachernii]|uniref:TnpA transposase n=1 Tax=Legionella maceachernii TaxID=466 RepID=A0A0W0W6M2_9GAMM|nr:ISL3 family transposase [Legionella maceachernii]KTD27981.1 TnpA transposase [Legionella maceachernii]SKA06184.1 Transposase [Legionella maceachernii]SUO99915.1 Transposase and inactivated derivatives [Legionella maceachernii]